MEKEECRSVLVDSYQETIWAREEQQRLRLADGHYQRRRRVTAMATRDDLSALGLRWKGGDRRGERTERVEREGGKTRLTQHTEQLYWNTEGRSDKHQHTRITEETPGVLSTSTTTEHPARRKRELDQAISPKTIT